MFILLQLIHELKVIKISPSYYHFIIMTFMYLLLTGRLSSDETDDYNIVRF